VTSSELTFSSLSSKSSIGLFDFILFYNVLGIFKAETIDTVLLKLPWSIVFMVSGRGVSP